MGDFLSLFWNGKIKGMLLPTPFLNTIYRKIWIIAYQNGLGATFIPSTLEFEENWWNVHTVEKMRETADLREVREARGIIE